MKHVYLISICFAMLISSCSKVVTDDHSGESLPDIIGWKVSADGLDTATRALIEDYTDLRDACTALEGQEAEKIGLLGNYNKDGQTKVAFDNIDLWWWEKEDGNPFKDDYGNDSYWNYSGDDVYWTDNVDYTFKAYFPKSKVELQPGSGADKLLVVYDTEISQYDLLVAHRTLRAKSENPVNLLMKNALSALRFDFQFVESGVSDELICCWLENKTDNGFYTSSTLNYEAEIVWPQSTPNPAGTPFYYWEPISPLNIRSESAAVAYSTYASEKNGSAYTDNDGWVLIIPQASQNAGTVKLCFKTARGGNTVYSIDLPAYEFKAGYRYKYHVKLTSTGVELSLTIADWNERKSSYEIDFNE
jgi:hypothetical protein